jgi:hypothetical protein
VIERLGLTGVWDGFFSYPRRFASTAFTAVILQTGSALTGSVHEHAGEDASGGELLNATIAGECVGGRVRFVKTYDPAHRTHGRPIHYEGALSADGNEIEGRWTIPGDWSGRFLMRRSGGARSAAARRRRAAVPAG